MGRELARDGSLLTQDPIGRAGGGNLYAYAGNDPVAYRDPYGLCVPVNVCLGIAGALIGGATRFAFNLYSGRNPIEGVGSEMARGAAIGLTLGLAAPAFVAPAISAEITTGAAAGSRAMATLDRLETKFSNQLDHLTARDLEGAAKDLAGEFSGGQHLKEVRDAARGLVNGIRVINGMLQNPNLAADARQRAIQFLAQMTEKLNDVKRTLDQ